MTHRLQFTPAHSRPRRNCDLPRRYPRTGASGKMEANTPEKEQASMARKKTKSIMHGGKRVSEILEAHQSFFTGKDGGVRADLSGANLSGADLSGANLSGALLPNANLEGADLRKARLPHAH